MRLLTSLIAAGVLAAAAPAAAATYVAYDQFQLVGGAVQTGAFSVGSYTGAFTGNLTAFTTTQTACSGDTNVFCVRTGEALVAKAPAGAYDQPGTAFYQDGFLNMHTDTGVNSAIQFVAQTAGSYNFTGRYQAHDTSPTGVDIAGYVGTTQQFADTFAGGFRTFNFDANLAAGEKVSFILGAAGNYTYDSTGFALTVTSADLPGGPGGVPEPATWAMMILGFFGMGASLRNRRQVMA